MSRRTSFALAIAASALLAAPVAAQLPQRAGIAAPFEARSVLVPSVVAAERAAGGAQRGRSGALRASIVGTLEALDLPYLSELLGRGGSGPRWAPLFGTAERQPERAEARGGLAPPPPGMWKLETGFAASGTGPFTYIAQVPFAAKRGGFLNGYHIGTYPTEGTPRRDRYAPPAGFIEVTPENQDVQLSEHFRLRQFITKDQARVWPKYVALDIRLIDKLELVIEELNAMGVRADRYHVMSGYRTPQYNGPGGDGRSSLSRHMYGDAADGWVDNDGDGYMDDLNGDGRVDLDDARVILRAVERVEAKYPELVGGCGLYRANSAHGPFVHIDVRGTRARW